MLDKTSESTKKAIIKRLRTLPSHAKGSITYDNGSENYYHEDINSALGMMSYFCKPYHSWEKGAVENSNELIRRYIPKKTNLDTISEEDIRLIEDQINNRPRKCLRFRTPAEMSALYCSNGMSP